MDFLYGITINKENRKICVKLINQSFKKTSPELKKYCSLRRKKTNVYHSL